MALYGTFQTPVTEANNNKSLTMSEGKILETFPLKTGKKDRQTLSVVLLNISQEIQMKDGNKRKTSRHMEEKTIFILPVCIKKVHKTLLLIFESYLCLRSLGLNIIYFF